MTVRPYMLPLTARELLVLRSAIDQALDYGNDVTDLDAEELDALDRRLHNLYMSRSGK